MRAYTEFSNLISGAALNLGGRTTFSRELPMGEGWYAANLRIKIVLTAGSASGAIAEGELLLIRNVTLSSDRDEVFYNLPGRAIYKWAHILNGVAPNKNAIAAASATYFVNLPMLFADRTMLRPEDTIIDTSRYSSMTLEVQLGSIADLFTTTTGASIVCTCDFEVERSLGELSGDPANPNGGGQRPLFHVSFANHPPIDANDKTTVDVDRSPDLTYKRLMVHHGGSATSGQPFSGANADDAVDVISFEDQNKTIIKKRPWEMVKDDNMNQFGLPAVIPGLNVFNFVQDGSIKSAYPTGNASVLQVTWTNQASVAANDGITVSTQGMRTLK